MFRKVVVLSLVVAAAALMAVAAGAQGPQPASPRAALGTAFTYQGRVRQNDMPVSGSVTLTFRLYDVSAGGSPLATLGKTVTATNGLFTTQLDFGNAFDGGARWLGISIAGDPELAPRQALTAVPYALYASGNWALSGNAGTSPGTNFIGTSDNQPLVFRTNGVEAMRLDANGRLGIGTTTPTGELTVLNGTIHSARTTYMVEGFESAGFPPAGWTTGGAANWVRDPSGGYASAAAAVTVTDLNAMSFLGFPYTTTSASQLRFVWRSDVYTNVGYLLFCLDNNACTKSSGYNQRITGVVGWKEIVVPVTAGAHSFRWVLATGSSALAPVTESGWLDRVRLIDAGGNLLAEGRAEVDQLYVAGMNITPPPRAVEVNGVIGVHDGGGRTYFGGMASEGFGQMVNFGINDDSANRFGGNYSSNAPGGFVRVDARGGYNLFQFLARPALTTTSVSEIMGISGDGTVRMSLGSGQKLSLGGVGTFEIDAPFVPAGRFYVDNAGHVGIGHNTPSHILQIQQGSTTDPIADAWTTYSSRRWKSGIVTIEGALDKVERLRGVMYDWTANGKHDIGLIAEEVGQVVPEVVVYEDNRVDAKSVDYARLVALLVESTKEQQRQIEAQRGQIASLEARLSALEQRPPDGSRSPGDGALGLAGAVTSGNISLAGLLAIGVAYAFRRRKAR